MVRLFVQVVGEGESGIVVKLEGHASLNQQTGQLTVDVRQQPAIAVQRLETDAGWRARVRRSRTPGFAVR